MTELKKLTAEYIPTEDRIRLSGQISGDRIVTIWLTQRMLALLLPHLFDWLNKNKNDDNKIERSRDDSIRDIAQSFAQEAAIINLAKQNQTPVRPGVANDHLLVNEIDITAGDVGIKIGFKSDTSHDELKLIELTMAHEPLRQWLHIMFAQVRVAGWDLRCWPEWMNNAETGLQKMKQMAH